ncbi:MAG: A/G-specific adenine glycosylase, partial [Acidimicrobiia bacterium]
MNEAAVTVDRNDALLAWYQENRRDLPWRRTNEPYPILVSEVMLQQTQVDRVIPKFDAFMEQLPTVGELASIDTTTLLGLWSGLGYNNRALRLRSAAVIVDANGWPTTAAGLSGLPGVGPYTANAIASISFGEQVAAVDTNLKRVLSRWVGISLAGSELQRAASVSLGTPASEWNQALMDLGSSLCSARAPQCSSCPVELWCIDPTIYEPPAKQPAFKGSNRELRGAMVRAHVAGEDPHRAGS